MTQAFATFSKKPLKKSIFEIKDGQVKNLKSVRIYI